MRRTLSSLFALSFALASTSAQGLIREHVITGPLGVAVVGLSDVDGDLIADYAVAGTGSNGLGEISVFSGASGMLLRNFAGDATTGPIGGRLADASDVDGDGVSDLAVGGDHGAAVFSIATGARMYWFPAPTAGQPVAVAGLGDVDADGYGDVLVGVAAIQLVHTLPSMGWTAIALGPSYAEVRSGQTGAVVRTHFASATPSSYGATVCALGDTDGDGVRDYAVSTRMDPTPYLANVVDVFSGASGTLLRSFALGATSALTIDGSLADMGDLDGDGLADLAIGEPTRNLVRCVSIATGATIASMRPAQPPQLPVAAFAASIAALPDVDLDGVRDLAVAVVSPPCLPGAPPCDIYLPSFEVFSGASGANLLGWWPADGNGQLMRALSGVGDIDGDGRGELLLGLDLAFTPPSTLHGRASLRSTLHFAAPENFCRPQDTQAATSITWSGSTSVAAADFQLIAYDAPPARPGYFLATRRSGLWSTGATSLCLRPPGLRLGPSLPTSAHGQLTHDPFAGPSSSSFAAGTTWFFEFIYESASVPGAFFGSDALAVTFAP